MILARPGECISERRRRRRRKGLCLWQQVTCWQVNLHWIGGVPVDVAQPVGRSGRLADELDEHKKKVDGPFGRHSFG